MKKVITIILTVCLLSSMFINTAFASGLNDDYVDKNSKKEEILGEYREKLLEVELGSLSEASTNTRAVSSKSKFDQKLEIQAEAVEELKKLGYEAYDVNPQTFESVGEILNTDLTAAGLSEDGAYLIIMNEESFIYPNAETGDPFTHTYLGSTYTLRYMTVKATDDPAFRKTSAYDVLTNSVNNLIMNCLDTAVQICVEGIWKPLGTIASILGLSISDLLPSYDDYLIYNAASSWTRIYTQVWDDDYQTWFFGSYVETVKAGSYFNSWYLCSYSGIMKQLVTPVIYRDIYSEEYFDFAWRKDYGVLGYLTSMIYSDITEDVEYCLNGEAVMIHYHNF